jgi:hypothetical protein
MSISAISSTSPASTQATSNPLIQDLKALQNDLSQGNVSAAQQDLATLEKTLSNSPAGAPAANSPLGQALTQLQKDLQTGNTSSAQTALTAVKTAMRHGHHHGGGESASVESGISASGTSSTSANSQSSQSSVSVPSQSTSGSVLDTSA